MIKASLRLSVSLTLLIGLLWWVGTDAVWSQFRDVSPVWLGIAAMALTLSTFSMSRRWQITVDALGLELPYAAAVKEYYVALLANAVLPGGVVGDISRAYRLRHAGDFLRSAQSVLAERVIGQAAMLIILAAGLSTALVIPGGIVWPTGTVPFLIFGSVLLIAALAFLYALKSTRAFIILCAALGAKPSVILHALGAGCLLILALYACARATSTDVPFEAVTTVLPLILCAMLIPLSFGGWGWREGAAAALFPLFGATPEAGVAAGLCYGIVMLVAALPGAFFMFRHAHNPELDRT